MVIEVVFGLGMCGRDCFIGIFFGGGRLGLGSIILVIYIFLYLCNLVING